MTGFETLFATIRNDIRSKSDVLVAIIHFSLVQNKFVCVGIGENFPETAENGSELLPNNWNTDADTYVLRYVCNDKKLLVKCVKVGDALIISALQVPGDSTGSSTTLRAADYVTDNYNDYNTVFIGDSFATVSQLIQRDIISKLESSANQSRSDEKQDNRRRNPERNPLIDERVPIPSPYDYQSHPSILEERRFPPPIGGADLDPFGHRQGGMLMDPRHFPQPFRPNFNPGGGLGRPLPPGAVPPGARFDPFGPPAPGPRPTNNPRNPQFGGPDPDHLPPPGYDDMFM